MAEDTQNAINQALHSSLLEIGLTELESRLYIRALSTGPTLMSKLAKDLAVARPNLYKIADSLQKKSVGMFSKEEGYNRRFMVVSPSDVFAILNEKKSKISEASDVMSQALPELMSLYRQGEAPTKVNIVRGRREVVELFNRVFDEAREDFAFLGSNEDLAKFMSEVEVEKQIKKRVSKGIKIKFLTFPGEYTSSLIKRDAKELRDVRYIKDIKQFVTSFYLLSNKIVFWQPKVPLAVVMEDELLVQMFQSIFDHLWEEGTPAK
jgi:sugar-specific transcriptional regulator TrmB